MTQARSYDPLKNYGNGTPKSAPSRAASAVSPMLPRNILGAPKQWRIAAILDGTDDEQFQHVPTSAELTSCNFTIRLAHGLSFNPSVDGTLLYGDERFPLPHHHFSDGTTYFNGTALYTPDFVVTVDKVDNVFITMRVVIMNSNGSTIFAANPTTPLKFKLVCFEEAAV